MNTPQELQRQIFASMSVPARCYLYMQKWKELKDIAVTMTDDDIDFLKHVLETYSTLKTEKAKK